MDPRINKHLAERRAETCPQQVIENVLAVSRTHRNRTFIWVPALTAFVLLLLGQFIFPSAPPHSEVAQAVGPSAKSLAVANDTHAVITAIGHVLVEAGNRSAAIIARETLPPLQNGIGNTKQALMGNQDNE